MQMIQLDDGDGDGDFNRDGDNSVHSSCSSSSSSKHSETSSTDDPDMKNYKGFRMVTFRKDIVTQVHSIPRLEVDDLDDLFYTKKDFARFQASEQKRHDKRMMKQIQGLVHEAMKDQLDAARSRGATEEEMEAMMPQTPEDIFAVLGGIPTPTPGGIVAVAMMNVKPPPPVIVESMHIHQPVEKDKLDFIEEMNPNVGKPRCGPIDGADNERNCDDEYNIGDQQHTDPNFALPQDEKHHQAELRKQEDEKVVQGEMHDLNSKTTEGDEGALSRNEKRGGNGSENIRDRPEQLVDFSDDDLYSIFGVCNDDDTKDITVEQRMGECKLQGTLDDSSAGDTSGKKSIHHLQRPEQLVDFSDNDLYEILGVLEDNIDSKG
jgi:hypothetical protein